jgi:crotonobetainyl-CoA:carnitine CoA-transferase CaiB-like acyl-CoA transferase
MEREDLFDDPRFVDDTARRRNRAALLDVIQEWMLTFDDLDVLDKALQRGRLVLGVIRSVHEAVATPWSEQRGAVATVTDRGDGVVHVPQTPWRFDGLQTGVRGEPAYRGEHNREVFMELAGLTEDEIEKLQADDVLLFRGPSGR